MNRKGLMPLWFTAILGFIILVIGTYLAIAMFAVPLAFWVGIVLLLVGIGMIFITVVLQ